jgi:hypothetical protein
MSTEQRIFHRCVVFLGIILIFTAGGESIPAAEKREMIADGRISLVIPGGWQKTELNAADVLAGYATQDNRSSVFFRQMEASSNAGMQELLDGTIANYEATFKVKDVAKAKTGDVAGPDRKWPGIFTTVEATVVKGAESFEMKFYLLVFDTGTKLYIMQASTTLPIREARERQIYELIRSLVARE